MWANRPYTCLGYLRQRSDEAKNTIDGSKQESRQWRCAHLGDLHRQRTFTETIDKFAEVELAYDLETRSFVLCGGIRVFPGNKKIERILRAPAECNGGATAKRKYENNRPHDW